MKYLILILLTFYSGVIFAQGTTDTLHWNKNRKLTWDDFQGVPDSTVIYAANTVAGFVTKSRYTSDSTISVVITAVFYRKRAWQKTKYQTPQSLKHEQGHFDITEVYARKATAAFKKYKYNKATVNKDIDSIVNYYFNEMSIIDDLYDKETANHRNFTQQRIWDRKIAAWLKDE